MERIYRQRRYINGRKGNFDELFRDLKIDNERIKPKIFALKKANIGKQVVIYKKLLCGIQLLLSLRALADLYYLKAIKRKIEIFSELLALDIELSNEVHIP